MAGTNTLNAMTESSWIYEQNFQPCLRIAASETDTQFDSDDWDAIGFGLKGTSDIKDRWFDYTLNGAKSTLDFSCALDDGDTSTGIIHIRFRNLDDRIVAAKLSTLLAICSEYTFTDSST